jgi:hypothetical protein
MNRAALAPAPARTPPASVDLGVGGVTRGEGMGRARRAQDGGRGGKAPSVFLLLKTSGARLGSVDRSIDRSTPPTKNTAPRPSHGRGDNEEKGGKCVVCRGKVREKMEGGMSIRKGRPCIAKGQEKRKRAGHKE